MVRRRAAARELLLHGQGLLVGRDCPGRRTGWRRCIRPGQSRRRCNSVIRVFVDLQAAVSSKGRMAMRSPISSAASMAPMGLRSSSFAPTSFTVKSETELKAAINTISMALKPGQKPIVIGETCFWRMLHHLL